MEKKNYSVPQFEIIELDNEIALVLQTTPPAGPGEDYFLPEEEGKSIWE